MHILEIIKEINHIPPALGDLNHALYNQPWVEAGPLPLVKNGEGLGPNSSPKSVGNSHMTAYVDRWYNYIHKQAMTLQCPHPVTCPN